jgi:hypothetical protein
MDSLLVLAAAVLNFVFGAIWYGFFSKSWAKAWNLNLKEIDRSDPKPYLIAFIGSLWTSYGVFLAIKHIKPNSPLELFSIGLSLWLLICVGVGAKHYAFAKVKGSAFLIDYLLDLIGILLMCAIIGL